MEEHNKWLVMRKTFIYGMTIRWVKIKYQHITLPLDIQFMQIFNVNSIIQDINWNMPRGLSILTRQIFKNISKINLSFDNIIVVELVWTGNGVLSLKDAYNFITRNHLERSWTKFIWHPNILLAMLLVNLKLMHNVITTYGNLIGRGIHVVLMCSLCNCDVEIA